MSDEPFALDRTPVPAPRPPREPNPPERQRLLFSGLDCLPGQKDLFPTDGPPPREELTP